jgi:hypothetical protein
MGYVVLRVADVSAGPGTVWTACVRITPSTLRPIYTDVNCMRFKLIERFL